jgi:deoxyadenosine/deoxycytidine kinase
MAVKTITKKSSSLKSKPVKASLKPSLLKPSAQKSSSIKTPPKKIIAVKPVIIKKTVTPLHIAVAGNIGAGKTTLTTLLAKNMKWEPHFEDVDDNPYLNDFYEDMQRWSFNLQIYFLNSRFQQVMKIRQNPKTVIQDRTIYEDAYIFAPNLHSMGLMTTRDFNNYQSLFSLMAKFITPPDLLIYLRGTVPALVSQIQKRGRDYENSIRIDYLKRLNERYEAWISTYELGKLLIIDIDDINFAENPEHLGVIINKINAEIHGLF